MFHVELIASHREWLDWAGKNDIHPYVMEYIGLRPDHLWKQPPKTEEAFSTPRSWHMLSDALHAHGETDENRLKILACGCLSPMHATQFCAFVKNIKNRYALSAIIVTDMRMYRKLATLRGIGLGDILDKPIGEGPAPDGGSATDLDEFYRRALSQGLYYHQQQQQGEGRGYLPSGLVEEIRALSVPPIPWDVELARWFDEYFAPAEKKRTYARISRRQSAAPDIPRPNWTIGETALDGRTFGVLLDTSGSMDRRLLASALGAIASYAASRDVPAARVVFCDAAAYDMGYMRPEDIAGTVTVRGRGGTVLQPGVDLLEQAENFPKEAPLLIITDGYCDSIILRGREHAYLLPAGANLPFAPKGKVFRLT
jgi:hypothetical protein